jgi:lipoyl(octanoyl) transferase
MTPLIRQFGLCEYHDTHAAMTTVTGTRDLSTRDEFWYLQHPPVYTLGLAAKPSHILDAGDIPVIQSDRGGQVTYHGPGQLVVYLMLDLKRLGLSIKSLVANIEQSVIDMLAGMDINGARMKGAPGVYVNGKKIAALGIRVRRACSYHGLSFNVDMDLTPFSGINPCGYPGLEVTQLRDFNISLSVEQTARVLQPRLLRNLGYDVSDVNIETGSYEFLRSQAAA